MTWQPIETAPRDGTAFLTFSEDAHREPKKSAIGYSGTAMLVMAWAHFDKEPTPIDESGDWHAINDWVPTHWMPLPEPPSEDTNPKNKE